MEFILFLLNVNANQYQINVHQTGGRGPPWSPGPAPTLVIGAHVFLLGTNYIFIKFKLLSH